MNLKIKHIEDTGSTNETVIELINKRKAEPPFVLCAGHQLSGKGYHNNYWEDEKGKNILCSLVIRPETILPQDQFVITQIISLAVASTITSYFDNRDVKIKWPNDIYVNDKKIAGILIKNFIKGNSIDYSVIGLGLNVNQKDFLEKTPNPTSLLLETGEYFDKEEILRNILLKFNYYYSIAENDRTILKRKYIKNLYRYGKVSTFTDENNNIFKGKITDVTPYGQLIIETPDNKLLTFDFKEVKFII